MSDTTRALLLRRAGGGGLVLTNIASNSIIPAPNLPQVLTAAQATKALTPFIAWSSPRAPGCVARPLPAGGAATRHAVLRSRRAVAAPPPSCAHASLESTNIASSR